MIRTFIRQLVAPALLLSTGCSSHECLSIGCSSNATVYMESKAWTDGSYTVLLEFDQRSRACTFIMNGGFVSFGQCNDPGVFLIADLVPSIGVSIRNTPKQVSLTLSREGAEIARTSGIMRYEDVTPEGSCARGCMHGEMRVSIPGVTP